MAVQYTRILANYNLNQLQNEINSNTTIIPSLLSITVEDTTLTFDFAASLSAGEETELDVVIAAHVPDPITLDVTKLPFSDDTNKLAVQSSAKPLIEGKTTYAVWSGAGDNMTTGEPGGGDLLDFNLEPGTATHSIDIYFHPDNGYVWINEAYIRYEGAGQGDWIEGTIMAPASQLQTMANLDLVLDGNLVKMAPGGPGTGTHGFAATPALVARVFAKDGDWDWDWDTSTMTPNMDGTGEYRISIVETEAHKFVTRIPCRGTSGTYFNLASDDTARLWQPYFIRVTCHNVSNTAWNAQVFLEIYRERTTL